jgi:hypothetical protein
MPRLNLVFLRKAPQELGSEEIYQERIKALLAIGNAGQVRQDRRSGSHSIRRSPEHRASQVPSSMKKPTGWPPVGYERTPCGVPLLVSRMVLLCRRVMLENYSEKQIATKKLKRGFKRVCPARAKRLETGAAGLRRCRRPPQWPRPTLDDRTKGTGKEGRQASSSRPRRRRVF